MKFEKAPIPTTTADRYKEGECPECGGTVIHGTIPCPDGDLGCCVAHYGYYCYDCGIVLQPKEEKK